MNDHSLESHEPGDSSGLSRRDNITPAKLRPGDVVSEKYKILSPLGSGGMGTVYRVNHLFLQKDFALKTLDRRNMSAEAARRFHQEAKAAGALNHPNVVKVSDFGLMQDERPFLVMELVAGVTLSDWIATNGILDWELAIITLTQVCKGLSFAHTNGVIHRDVKPSNIIVDWPDPSSPAADSVKIVDFGIAKIAAHYGGEIQALTQTGEIFGSPLYMSPEQADGRNVDSRTDIYSAGCVLFYALTGSPPFVGESALQTMHKHQSEPTPTLRQAAPDLEFPDELEALVKKLLAKEPTDRHQDMAEVVKELNYILGTVSGSQNPSNPEIGEAKLIPFNKTGHSRSTRQLLYATVGCAFLILLWTGVYTFSQAPEQNTRKASMASVNRVYQNKKDSISSLALANKKKPIAYSQSITTSGVQQWLFMVPKDIGQAYSEAAGRTSRTEPSKTFSLNDTITLKIDEHYSPSVNFFNNFNPASVHRLIIKENATISDAHVRTFSNWTKLTILDLSGTDIDDDAIPYLSKIPNLSTLKIRKTLITGSGLARLRLRAPSSLTCLSLKDASKLLDSLKHSKQMTSLTLQDSNLTDDDLSKIATVTSLTNLSVADNVRLTEIGLSRLKALTKLGTIDLTGCQITASSANFLKQLRSLKSVIIDWSQWTDAQRGSFKKTLSPVEIKTLFPEKLI